MLVPVHELQGRPEYRTICSDEGQQLTIDGLAIGPPRDVQPPPGRDLAAIVKKTVRCWEWMRGVVPSIDGAAVAGARGRLGRRRRLIRALAQGTAGAALAAGMIGSAPAQVSSRVRFIYERKEGAAACPDEQSIRSGIAARLGYEPFDEAAGTSVRATVERAAGGLEADVQLIDEHGAPKAQRRIVSRRRDCVELSAAMELAITIAIDPLRATRPQPAPSIPPPPPPPPSPAPPGDANARPPAEVIVVAAAPPPVVQPISQPIPQPISQPIPPPISGRVEVGAVGGIGSAPVRTVGVIARGSARRRNVSMGIEGRVDLPASVPLQVGGVSTSLLVGSLVPCVHLRMIAACGLATGGALRAAGHGLVDARQVVVLYVALGARLYAAVPLGTRLSLGLNADLSAPLTQTELRVGGQELWTTPPLSVSAGLSLAASFP